MIYMTLFGRRYSLKGLFILSENPYPPRNGVTIPTYNHINIIKEKLDVCGVFFCHYGQVDNTAKGGATPARVKKRSMLLKVVDELFFGRPYFLSEIDLSSIKDVISKEGGVDYIYYSPISMAAVTEKLKKINFEVSGKTPKVIASISDCYTSVLSLSMKEGASKLELRNYIKYFRSVYMGRLERKLLEGSDSVLVQTRRDEWWLRKIGFEGDVKIITNGVHEGLFNIEPCQDGDVVFAGNFRSRFYQEKFVWFYKHVWRKLKHRKPGLRLYVYTSGYVPEKVADLVRNDSSIFLEKEFVKDVEDIYKNKTICVAPIFKDYGFINKVAEAMASGMVVIGDKSAFNGMEGFESGRHGWVANDADAFMNLMIETLDNKRIAERIGFSAQAYAKENFSWRSRAEILNYVFG